MTDTLQSDIINISREINRAAEESFTGKMTITLNMRQGGIGQIELVMAKNLKNEQNGKKIKKH